MSFKQNNACKSSWWRSHTYGTVIDVSLQHCCKLVHHILFGVPKGLLESRWGRGECGYRKAPSRERAGVKGPGRATEHWALRRRVKEGQKGTASMSLWQCWWSQQAPLIHISVPSAYSVFTCSCGERFLECPQCLLLFSSWPTGFLWHQGSCYKQAMWKCHRVSTLRKPSTNGE